MDGSRNNIEQVRAADFEGRAGRLIAISRRFGCARPSKPLTLVVRRFYAIVENPISVIGDAVRRSWNSTKMLMTIF